MVFAQPAVSDDQITTHETLQQQQIDPSRRQQINLCGSAAWEPGSSAPSAAQTDIQRYCWMWCKALSDIEQKNGARLNASRPREAWWGIELLQPEARQTQGQRQQYVSHNERRNGRGTWRTLGDSACVSEATRLEARDSSYRTVCFVRLKTPCVLSQASSVIFLYRQPAVPVLGLSAESTHMWVWLHNWGGGMGATVLDFRYINSSSREFLKGKGIDHNTICFPEIHTATVFILLFVKYLITLLNDIPAHRYLKGNNESRYY